MIIYKSEPLEKFELENIEYFKCNAMCRMIEKYGVEQGIFKFEIKELTDDEKAFELDRHMVGAEIYIYYGIQKDYKEMKEIIDNFRCLELKIEPKDLKDIEQINDKLYLTENINMIKVEPFNDSKGERL